MKVFYDERAKLDLERIENWIANDSQRSANRVISEIFAASIDWNAFLNLVEKARFLERGSSSCRAYRTS